MTQKHERWCWKVAAGLLVAMATNLGMTNSLLAGGKTDFTLTLLHNNDGESQLVTTDDFGGVDRFSTVVRDLRREGNERFFESIRNNILEIIGFRPKRRAATLISSGDNILAGPELNVSFDQGVPFLDSLALATLNYDALILGNHEFDFGPDTLADFIEGFFGTTDFLSANLDFSAEPRLDAFVSDGIIAKSKIVHRNGRKFGIIGATTDGLNLISSPRDVVVNDVLPAVQQEITLLESLGVNIIILSSHLQDVETDLELISQVSGIDLAIAGGGDELLANDDDLLIPGDEGEVFGAYPLTATDALGTQVPVVTTSGEYRYVGRLTAKFDKDGNLLSVVDEKSGPIRVAGGSQPDAVDPNFLLNLFIVQPLEAALEELGNNVIATTEVALEGSRPQIRQEETNLGNLVADSLLFEARRRAAEFGVPAADVALQNGGGIRNNNLIPAGNLTELDTFNILAFFNLVAVVPEMPRDQFRQLVERAAARLPGDGGSFGHFAGCDVVYNLTGTTAQEIDGDGNIIVPGTRVQSVILDDGTVVVQNGNVVPGPGITIATIDFLARDGDGYVFSPVPFTSLGVTYQQALSNYLTTPIADGGLGGNVTAAQYPEGGEGRITINP